MSLELSLKFLRGDRFVVSLGEEVSKPLEFAPPLDDKERDEIRWYLEVYSGQYTADVDDNRARKIEEQLPRWGIKLFEAAFPTGTQARKLFESFCECCGLRGLLSVSASTPEILALPWEILSHPKGTYLFKERPQISIRRSFAKERIGERQVAVQPKKRLRLLFIVSRPQGSGFLDPRADARAVLDALEKEAPGRFEVEFLRPATIPQLSQRLKDSSLPPIDIVHFDGHGRFDMEKSKGYLLFTNARGRKHEVSAENLAEELRKGEVSITILSACQSATVAGEEAIASVAARLTYEGISVVLAMSYSVLVETTRQLFGAFYRQLAMGETIGGALDEAREYLHENRDRGFRQRGTSRIPWQLEDWFLPTLYQGGKDVPLVDVSLAISSAQIRKTKENLPALQGEFFGRSGELWNIEQWFSKKIIRRVTILGFGGQGKTALAVEAARWLCRTGIFERACFVDYSAYKGLDTVQWAINTISEVFGESLVNVEATTRAIKIQPTLLILDNLEALTEEPLQELLTVVKEWSQVGQTRVLLTTRGGDYYPDDPHHFVLPLEGLNREDTWIYFQKLWQLPPAPKVKSPQQEDLLRLFELVKYHPLSIKLLVQELKKQEISDVGQALVRLLQETEEKDKNKSVIASLKLSLERLDEGVWQWFPRLGLFEGGAMENVLLDVIELNQEEWCRLKVPLETTGLLQAENLPGMKEIYLKFHPTLTPVLRHQLKAVEQGQLEHRYKRRYYALSNYLKDIDRQTPLQGRAIAQRELSNLLRAAYITLDTGEEWAVEFASSVCAFLTYFGLNRESVALTQRIQKSTGEVGSYDWFASQGNLGDQLISASREREALQVFEEMLAAAGEDPTFNRCVILGKIGQCLKLLKKLAQAAISYREALAVVEQLEVSDGVKQQEVSLDVLKRQISTLQADLATVLKDMGQFEEARDAYKAALGIMRQTGGNLRGEAVVQGQIGTLALLQGNLTEAQKYYREAIGIFQHLKEPASEAIGWHQLGIVNQEAEQWEAAEQAYRRSALIKESIGNLVSAANTYNQLGMLNQFAKKPEAAEAWFRKAITVAQAFGDNQGESYRLHNLAVLLLTQGKENRLDEVKELAEAALVIFKTLDTTATRIWTTYMVLAVIAQKQKQPNAAQEYRRLARQAKAVLAGTQDKLQQWSPLIDVVLAARDPAARHQFEDMSEKLVEQGFGNLMRAIRLLLNGVRDEEVLYEGLDLEFSIMMMAILEQFEGNS